MFDQHPNIFKRIGFPFKRVRVSSVQDTRFSLSYPTMSDYQHIVRIANTDIDGERQLLHGLSQIKGVDVMFANAACRLAGLHVQQQAGDVDDDKVEELNEIIENPTENGIPSWLVNRRRDPETGEDKHLLGGDINFTIKQDIKRLKEAKTYRGIRHSRDLTTRGQRTKGNFRHSGGGSLGVSREEVTEE